MASNARKLSRLIRQNIDASESVDTFTTSSDLSGGNESFVGDGSGLTQLNASNISTGTVSDDRLPNTISSDITGNAATSSLASDSGLLDGQGSSFYRNAGNLNAGTISDARLPATISSDITGNAATATNAANADQLDGINSTQFLRSDQNGTFGGDLTVSGNLTVNGTTTSVNSTVTTLDDPVITLANNSTSTDDGKDRGIEFKYGDGSNIKTGFFGFDDTDGRFKFIPDATNNSEVFSGTLGTIEAAAFIGDGTQLTGIRAGAQGGGTNEVFFQNDTNVTDDYTIDTGKNAMSAGPVTVDTGVTVTVPVGSVWSIV